jgi:hypothetical protein
MPWEPHISEKSSVSESYLSGWIDSYLILIAGLFNDAFIKDTCVRPGHASTTQFVEPR